jgi:hypothetical protein
MLSSKRFETPLSCSALLKSFFGMNNRIFVPNREENAAQAEKGKERRKSRKSVNSLLGQSQRDKNSAYFSVADV